MTFKDFASKIPCLWLAPKQVAKLMQCSIEHVYDLVKAGKICFIKDRWNIRFRPEGKGKKCCSKGAIIQGFKKVFW